jgi:hypothetical protein
MICWRRAFRPALAARHAPNQFHSSLLVTRVHGKKEEILDQAKSPPAIHTGENFAK